ncbi:MAG: hypothetical protein U0457_20460 [Candidatus Sericytochromatia bacterium]
METTNLEQDNFYKHLSDKEKMDLIRSFLLENSEDDSKEMKELRALILQDTTSENQLENDFNNLKNLFLTPEPSEMEKLKYLLFKEEQAQIDLISNKFKPENFTYELSNVLTRTIDIVSKKDNKFSEVLSPTIEDSLRKSVKKNPKALADALFPVMGPAIRHAIIATFESMISSMNQILEQSFSFKAFKWRLESFRTGKPFAEIIILNSLVYRVEQVFLIHKKTGLLLNHITNESVKAQDADIVSGMLTAIQDFIQDSFEIEKDKKLETLRVGELLLMIEQGPDAILAGIIRGTPNNDLREIFQQNIELIHLEMATDLDVFNGDNEAFKKTDPYLKECLRLKLEAKNSKRNYKAIIFLFILFFIFLFLLSFYIKDLIKFNTLKNKISNESGLVLINLSKEDGKYVLKGLKDAFAKNPIQVANELGIEKDYIIDKMEYYNSLDEKFVLLRAKKLLKPPPSITLFIKNKVLYATGNADNEWIKIAKNNALFISGILEYNDDNVFNNEFYELKAKLESELITFKIYTSDLDSNGQMKLKDLFETIKKIRLYAKKYNKKFFFYIRAYYSPEGGLNINKNLVVERENKIEKLLLLNKIDVKYFEKTYNKKDFDLKLRKKDIPYVRLEMRDINEKF